MIASATQRTYSIWDVLFEIAEQFKPNGGSSLYDRMSQLHDGQAALAVDVAGVKADVGEAKRQVENIITEELQAIDVLVAEVRKHNQG